MSTPNKAYLGDGVYIDTDDELGPDALVMTTENGISATNTIHLESEVIRNLLQYIERRRQARP